MATHVLKIRPQYLRDVVSGKKKFEVRKDDRNFQVGDILVLVEFDTASPCPEFNESHSLDCVVTYKLPGGQFGIESGYCVLGIELKG